MSVVLKPGHLARGAGPVVINKGDEELLGFKDRRGW